jgi:hypothetical protein
MTSKADTLTWVNGDPKTGTWRESANEWGNLTIMGRAFVSENAIPTNTSFPDAGNFAIMEGLLVDPSDPLANEKCATAAVTTTTTAARSATSRSASAAR